MTETPIAPTQSLHRLLEFYARKPTEEPNAIFAFGLLGLNWEQTPSNEDIATATSTTRTFASLLRRDANQLGKKEAVRPFLSEMHPFHSTRDPNFWTRQAIVDRLSKSTPEDMEKFVTFVKDQASKLKMAFNILAEAVKASTALQRFGERRVCLFRQNPPPRFVALQQREDVAPAQETRDSAQNDGDDHEWVAVSTEDVEAAKKSGDTLRP